MEVVFRKFVVTVLLLASAMSMAGCAAGWFIAGAATAATVAVVANEQEKSKE